MFRLFAWITTFVFLGVGCIAPHAPRALADGTSSDKELAFQRGPELREAPLATHTFVAKPSPAPVGGEQVGTSGDGEKHRHLSTFRCAAAQRPAASIRHARPTLVGVVELRL